MKRFLTVAVVVALVAFCSSANAGQIWTDGNGDGLPDGAPINATPSTNVTVGVWMDAQSYNWTNYLAYVEWPAGCFTYVSASYVITGGSNFPIDNFSHPNGIGFGGSGFTQTGVDLVGNLTLHLDQASGCCVTPIIDIYNPFYVFSSLGNAPAGTYMLFTTNPGTCFGEPPPQNEACCFPDGSCSDVPPSVCSANGGAPQGPGSNCASANCPQPQFEACCFPDGSCVDRPLGGCPAGSAPQGAGTSCATVTCPDIRPREACCFADGSCVDAIAGACPAGSVGQGAGTSCATFVCPQPQFEACCFPSGACANAPLGQCPAGSVGQGAGTSCATFVCPQPQTEACCFPNGSCVDAPLGGCPAGSVGQGVGTACATTVCPPSTATESKSWGNIKGLYR